jgi:hypothetical protein
MSKITEAEIPDIIKAAFRQSQETGNYANLLPLLFNLNGSPYTISRNHFQFYPLFEKVLSPQMTFKTGRQVAKSMTLVSHSLLMGKTNLNTTILHVAPLFEQIRNLSTNYLQPFIAESPFPSLFNNRRCQNSILQKTLPNQSKLIFTFAWNDCTRIRGKTGDVLIYDEFQSMNPSFEEIIEQTVAAKSAATIDWRNADSIAKYNAPLVMRFGTPLTLDNILEASWSESSQAEWVIQCESCRYENVPSYGRDLDKMMGDPYRQTPVTAAEPGLVCAKCGKYINTRNGRWMHNFPERYTTHQGYHIPQPVMAFHCENDTNWRKIQVYRTNRHRMSEGAFWNEICGESFDKGQRLISVTDLRNAAVLARKDDMEEIFRKIKSGRYVDWGTGIDWGGGGSSGVSKSCFAFGGLTPEGIIEIFTGHRSPVPNNFNLEAARTVQAFNFFQCKFAAMDFQGKGDMRYVKCLEAGLPERSAIPFVYAQINSNGSVARQVPYNRKDGIPAHLQIGKTKSFNLLAEYIKNGRVRFFQYDYVSNDEPGLLNDFTNLVEEEHLHAGIGTTYIIGRDRKGGPDDFANACNYLVAALYIRNGGFPDAGLRGKNDMLTPEQLAKLGVTTEVDKDMSWFHQ